MHLFMQTVT